MSVVLYIVVPVIAAQLWRRLLLANGGPATLARTLRPLSPLSLSALLLTLVLLFGLQGEQIVRAAGVIALLAVPILIQVYFNAGLAYWLNRRLGVEWCVAGPSALIGPPICSNWPWRRRSPVWLPVRRGAFNGRRRAGRSAGHAVGRPSRPPFSWLVRARRPRRARIISRSSRPSLLQWSCFKQNGAFSTGEIR